MKDLLAAEALTSLTSSRYFAASIFTDHYEETYIPVAISKFDDFVWKDTSGKKTLAQNFDSDVNFESFNDLMFSSSQFSEQLFTNTAFIVEKA